MIRATKDSTVHTENCGRSWNAHNLPTRNNSGQL